MLRKILRLYFFFNFCSVMIAQGVGVAERSEIDTKYKWDMKRVYKTEKLWEKDLKKVKSKYVKISDYKGKVLSNRATLLEVIRLDEEVDKLLGKLYHYASNSYNVDQHNEEFQKMLQKVKNEWIKYSELRAFFAPEVLESNYKRINKFMKKEPALKVYEKYFKDIYIDKPHILSEKEEKILSMAGKISGVSSETFDIMKSTDFRWGTFKDNQGNDIIMSEGRYGKYNKSPNRQVRKDMYEALYVPFKNSINTMSVLMKSNVESHIFYARARGYNSTLDARLKGAGIPTKIYHNLINSVNDNLKPLHRWADLKAKYLNLDYIEPFDTYVSLSKFSRDYTYEEAQEIVRKALMPLGPEIQKIIDIMYSQNLIDVFENKGKDSGAYMSSTWGLSPRIKLNFSGKLDDVFTLAHELGHAFHSYLSEKKQPYPYHGYDTFNAEVASVTTESLLMDYLLKNSKNSSEKAVLLQKYIQDIGSTYYRQARFAEFELKIHEAAESGIILTESYLTKTFGEIYSKYWGPSMKVLDQEKYSWSRIPHFYYNYYVYAYATSFAAGEKISERIKADGQIAIDDFISFLSSGSSDYPVELLKLAGVDMSTAEPFEAVSRKLNYLMDELENILQ